MGLYACLPCLQLYELPTADFGGCVAPCEICGRLRNDWETKWTNFTWEITRFADPISEQLTSWVTWVTEVGSVAYRGPDSVSQAFL